MTDYNDGKWHGWNGGECPVHPKTQVNGIEWNGPQWYSEAGDNDWQSFRGAFRVVKAYREPREWWMNVYPDSAAAHESKEKADECATKSRIVCIHVREVLE